MDQDPCSNKLHKAPPTDIYFSAAEDKFNSLVEDGFIKEEDGTQLLENELVLVAPIEHNGVSEFDDLLQDDVQRISIGTPDTVPAGKYAKEDLNITIYGVIFNLSWFMRRMLDKY